MTTIAISRAAHVLAFAIGLLALADHPAVAQTKLGSTLSTEVAAIEKRTGGRLGVSVTDVHSGANWSYRGKERFPLASTFKAFSCAHLLSLADKGSVDLGKRIQIQPNELETYSPVTRFNTGGKGMSLFELCDATTSMSDNTAANIILRNTGGPEALTRFIRSIGDEATRFDRFEPQLNDVGPGEVRDTTTPEAAAASLRKLVLGDVLSQPSRRQIENWLVANKVGGPLLRASVPDGWKVADRTGSGEYGSRGVIAVFWPKKGEASTNGPVVAAIYLTGTKLTLEERNTALAEVGAALVRDLTP
jgi:beta-lactamase class A